MAGELKPFPAPAKLNLFLHVTGRRADGYHLLQSVFRFVDHGDTVWLGVREDGQIRRLQGIPGVPEAEDLTVRAARLLQQEAGCAKGADIRLEKRLPMGGGLGGGSSDAATVLLGLNRLWGLGLPRLRLQELALRLGADVPVFVFGRSAFAEGVGEVLTPVALPPAWYVVLIPPVSVVTAGVFAAPELTRNTPPIRIADFLSGAGRNDLQPVVASKYPEVARHLDWLRRFGDARMTGSGACVFLAVDSEDRARSILKELPRGMQGFVARGLDKHPLFGLAE
ncbi:MAG: 4-(cytidine 5'-diphospho)-2-C-methyl-D-erythritol kinase [Pseudomonadota bacterium]